MKPKKSEIKEKEQKEEEHKDPSEQGEEIQDLVPEISEIIPKSLHDAEVVVEVKSEEPAEVLAPTSFDVESWNPRTSLGKKVKAREIASLDYFLDQGIKILEAEIVDALLPSLEVDLLLVGQSKGKFGGGQRRVFKQTQKKTREGNKPSFLTFALVGNKNGYLGLGSGKSRETVPAREKAIRKAKLNIIKVARGCGSWECHCKEPHSIPYAVTGKCGSVRVRLIPAPKGTGLVIEPELGKLVAFAGIKDVWSKTLGHTKTKTNAIKATFDALVKLTKVKYSHQEKEKLGIIEGSLSQTTEEASAP